MNEAPDRYRILVEFAYKHLEFLVPELESVLAMNGIQLDSPQCKIETLPNQSAFEGCENCGIRNRRPFMILSIDVTSIHVSRGGAGNHQRIADIILARCTLVRNIYELWGVGYSITDCVDAVKTWKNRSGASCFQSIATKENSWKLNIHTLGTKYTLEEHAEMRKHFSFLELPGPVRMKEPTFELTLVREIELDTLGGVRYPRFDNQRRLIEENDKRPAIAYYFGRCLCQERKAKGRGIEEYSLKKRKYLGPTSMDAQLSFIMANFAHVGKGSMVFDPFVGTGSILLSCALYGAYCVGSDIDIRVLRGLGKSNNVFTNFDQFGLPHPELIRSDNAIYDRHFRTNHALYDAIICDPPYGIRAGARRTGSKKDSPREVLDEHRHDHIAQTRVYEVSDVMADLLDVAARTLVLDGWLVYIIPSFSDFDSASDLPTHPCLNLTHTCYQPLGEKLGRRVVAMNKTAEYDESRRDEYTSAVWVNGNANACDGLKLRILENAKQKPGYDERLAQRKQRRRESKAAKKRAKRESQSQPFMNQSRYL